MDIEKIIKAVSNYEPPQGDLGNPLDYGYSSPGEAIDRIMTEYCPPLTAVRFSWHDWEYSGEEISWGLDDVRARGGHPYNYLTVNLWGVYYTLQYMGDHAGGAYVWMRSADMGDAAAAGGE